MFISVAILRDEMGVDETIARFFVDRKVPAENAFWAKKYVYVSRSNGYISIPVYYDLLFRIGIPREALLEEEHVRFMEKLMHYAILHEHGEISFFQQLEKINEQLAGRIRNQVFYDELLRYLNQPVLLPAGRLGMELPSLNRADLFLFVLCDLPMSDQQLDQAIALWYALHPSYLIFDDFIDYGKDRDAGEENVLLDLGGGIQARDAANGILVRNAEKLGKINPALRDYLYSTIQHLKEQLQGVKFD